MCWTNFSNDPRHRGGPMRDLMEIVSTWHVPKLLLSLFHHPLFHCNFQTEPWSHFALTLPFLVHYPQKKFLFFLIQKDHFLGHLKTHTNKINQPQNSLQLLTGWKLPPQDICFVCSSVAEFSGLNHRMDSVPGTKVKSWCRRKLVPQNS